MLRELDNESILLMYLAGELSDVDRAQVDQMLQRDPALRERLAELAATSDAVTAMLGRSEEPIAASRRESAVRSVSRAMVAARRARLAADAAARLRAPPRSLHLKRFLFPAVAAAGLVIGILLWPRTIQMNPPEGSQYTVADFPDVLALEVKVAGQDAQPDPLTTIEQELLSLGGGGGGAHQFDPDAWEPLEPVEER